MILVCMYCTQRLKHKKQQKITFYLHSCIFLKILQNVKCMYCTAHTECCCKIDGYKQFYIHAFRGAEWPTVIVLDLVHSMFSTTYRLCESITRARNHVIIVTDSKTSKFLNILGSAVDHGNESGNYQCRVCSDGSKRSFIGKVLLERALGGNTLVKVDGELREVPDGEEYGWMWRAGDGRMEMDKDKDI